MSEELAVKAAKRIWTGREWRTEKDLQSIIRSVYADQTAELERLRRQVAAFEDAAKLELETVVELQREITRLSEENTLLRGVVSRGICHPEDVTELERRGIEWC